MSNIKAFLIVSVLIFLSCQNSKINQSCGENPGKDTLIVFVGEKIDVKFQPQEAYSLDGKFLVTYKILERVCGEYKEDTIRFYAYDHYGYPEFANYKTVLLYVSKDEEGYYHQKYQYNNVYKTKEGIWAGPYKRFGNDYGSNDVRFKPVKINFNEEVSF